MQEPKVETLKIETPKVKIETPKVEKPKKVSINKELVEENEKLKYENKMLRTTVQNLSLYKALYEQAQSTLDVIKKASESHEKTIETLVSLTTGGK